MQAFPLNSRVTITPQQLEIMKSPITRAHLPGNKGDFAYFDLRFKENGVTCPQLPHIWDKVFPPANKDLQQWLSKTFNASITKPVMVAPKPARNIVNKAINVLQSYKRT